VTDLCVIVPSRGRPDNVKRLVDSWKETGATADLLVAMDNDDETWTVEDGEAIMDAGYDFLTLTWGPRIRMGPTLNREARALAGQYRYLGFMGDDHLPRTPEWDKRICEGLESCWGAGIVYGNDLFQGINLPTAVFMDSRIVQTLGYMCPPEQTHLYLDNAWKSWGQQMGPKRLKYLPLVVIEHIHPHAEGKAEWDDRYEEVNSPEMYAHDLEAWNQYQLGQMIFDVEKLRDLPR
jgi:hypothetical protein